jgi:hypothetical protein
MKKYPSTRQKILPTLLFGLMVVLGSVYIFKNPQRFWDMLPYMGSVLSMETNEPMEIHSQTYVHFMAGIPDQSWERMLNDDAFTHDMAWDTDHFNQQLPFFKIKALYIYTSYLFYQMGFPLFTAVLLPSLLAFIFISFLIYYWLSQHFKPWITFILATLFFVLNLNFDAFRIASPDAMSAAFLILGTYFFIEKNRLSQAAAFLLLGLLTRPDNLFFVGFLLVGFLFFFKRKDNKQAYSTVGFLILAIISILLLRIESGGYDAYRMFYRSFVQLVVDPQTANIHFDLPTYLGGIKNGLKMSLHNKIIYLLPLATLGYYFIRKFNTSPWVNLWMLAMGLSVVARIFVHPLFETRYLFGFLVVILLLTVVQLKQKLPSKFK